MTTNPTAMRTVLATRLKAAGVPHYDAYVMSASGAGNNLKDTSLVHKTLNILLDALEPEEKPTADFAMFTAWLNRPNIDHGEDAMGSETVHHEDQTSIDDGEVIVWPVEGGFRLFSEIDNDNGVSHFLTYKDASRLAAALTIKVEGELPPGVDAITDGWVARGAVLPSLAGIWEVGVYSDPWTAGPDRWDEIDKHSGTGALDMLFEIRPVSVDNTVTLVVSREAALEWADTGSMVSFSSQLAITQAARDAVGSLNEEKVS